MKTGVRQILKEIGNKRVHGETNLAQRRQTAKKKAKDHQCFDFLATLRLGAYSILKVSNHELSYTHVNGVRRIALSSDKNNERKSAKTPKKQNVDPL